MNTFDEAVVSDLHKDAYGFRPDDSFWHNWAAFNPEQKQRVWDNMIVDLNQSIDEDRAIQENAVVEFEDCIDDLMHNGTTRKDVVEWLMVADRSANDDEYFEYLNGLPYGYLKSKGYV